MSKKAKALIIIAATLFLALGGVATYFLIYYRVVKVPIPAMANTIISGDRVLCRMHVGEIKRGDILIFKLPEDPGMMFVKRVIGLPGETIQVMGRRVFINGGELPEERALVRLPGPQESESLVVKVEPKPQAALYRVFYDIDRYSGRDYGSIDPGVKYGAAEPYKIPPDNYFLLGDSRDNSMDSRFWGTVPRDLIVGKALMIFDSSAKGAEGRLFKPLK
jgi:signal peptidase I